MKYCCDALLYYKQVMDNVKLSLYNPEDGSMFVSTHGETYPFTFCPFCGVRIED